MNFFLNKNGQKLGPYSVEQIQLFLQQGLVSLDDQVWAEGWSSWLPIRNVPSIGTSPQFAHPVNQTGPAQNNPVPYGQPTPAPLRYASGYAEGKEPVIACVLSLVIVGTGQFYNGEWAKGWFLLLTCIVASFLSCGTVWFGYALCSAIDAYRVAARLKPLNSWNWFA